MVDLKAENRYRYPLRMARLKASGEYEAFRQKKAVEGIQRYWAITE